MNFLLKNHYRFVQFCMKIAMPFLRIPKPHVLPSCQELANQLRKEKKSRPLLVTDQGLAKLGVPEKVLRVLKDAGLDPICFDGAVPNPTFDCIEDGFKVYQKEGCDCLIALGGGSAMDCAKGIGIRSAYPKKSLSSFKGVLHVHRRIPLFFAIPTTAGTGSEATLAAVVVNSATHDKFQIDDPKLVPSFAVLDPQFVMSLPGKLIASTGMDALTHAIESYIGRSSTRFTNGMALSAIRRIDHSLLSFYENPKNEVAARDMQLAAFEAGMAFTRAYVGYVHALAHALGGYYGIPHGYANAVLLPLVLKHYGSSVYSPLASIYDALGRKGAGTPKEKAEEVIRWIEEMNQKMGIPAHFGGVVTKGDYDILADHAAKEGNPLYPVPELWDAKKLEEVLKEADGQ
ncbi:iron-containing alcohol dehydrogenase [bacterium]|nr:iron-containing alcohol dehydrogenase [bacterium]